jgi:Holliday junction resolvasome RuvABC DNA-binding subunit
LDSPPPGGAHNPAQLEDEKVLFDMLFDLGYSAPEIATITEQVASQGSEFTDPQRVVEQSALEKYGF